MAAAANNQVNKIKSPPELKEKTKEPLSLIGTYSIFCYLAQTVFSKTYLAGALPCLHLLCNVSIQVITKTVVYGKQHSIFQ